MPDFKSPFEPPEPNENEDFLLLISFFVNRELDSPPGTMTNLKQKLLWDAEDEEDRKCWRMIFAVTDFVLALFDAWDETRKREYLVTSRPHSHPREHLRGIKFYLIDQGVIVQLPRPHKGNSMLGLDPNVMHICLRTNPDGSLQAPCMLSSFN